MAEAQPQSAASGVHAGPAHAPAEEFAASWARVGSQWDRDAARAVLAAGEALLDAADARVAARAGDFTAFLAAFIDESEPPTAVQHYRLGGLAQALIDAITGSAPTPAAPAAPDPARASAPAPAPAPGKPASLAEARGQRAKVQRNRVCVLGIPEDAPPGLLAALAERGMEGMRFGNADELAASLAEARPGALLLDSGSLRHLPRLNAALAPVAIGRPEGPVLIVVSARRDLTDRLLSMRAGAQAFFQAPLDSYRIAGRLSELLGRERASGFRVLLADADRAHAAECAGWLSEQGMIARLAGTGEAALAALAEFRPDLVLVAEGLPDARGFELAQMVRQQPEWTRLPLVLISDELSEAQRFDAIAAGADDVLQKPLKGRHLSAVVQSRILHERTRGGDAQSLRDPSTGLVRRERVIERLGEVPRPGSALLFVTVDHAERVRARIGLSGLMLLVGEMARALREACTSQDWPAALSDFSFLVLAERASRGEVTALAERIRARLGECQAGLGDQSMPLTASVGATQLEPGARNADERVAPAEAAAVAASRLGGNRVLWHEPAEHAAAHSDPTLAVRAVLMRPWHEDNVQVEFRPLVPLAGKLGGQFELYYWLVSTRDLGARAGHALYAKVAAEIGMLATIERRRLGVAMSARAEAVKQGRAIRVLLPVSVAWLLQEGEIEWLVQELGALKLSGSGLGLEIQSAEFLDRLTDLGGPLAKLRQAGIRVGLGDYGRDWAAIHALKRHPLDYLRLFPELMEFAAGRATGEALQAVVRKAHQMHAAVIAPGVDTLEGAHALLRLGVDYASGDGLGGARPTPEFDFDRPIW